MPWRRLCLWTLLCASVLNSEEADARSKKKPRDGQPEQPTTAGGMPSPLVDPMEAEHSSPPTGTGTTGSGSAGSSGGSTGSGSSATSGSGGGSSGSSSSSAGGGSSGSSGGRSDGMGSGGEPGQYNKPGRFMLNLKIGPSICATGCTSHEGAAVLDFGWSVLPNKHAYVVVPLQFHFSMTTAAVMVPFGFQYDFGISKVPGLYLYPRVSVGYAALFDSSTGVQTTTHAGLFLPELGAKFILRGRFNFGGEIFSLPVIFGRGPFSTLVNVSYRILLYAGVNF